MTWRDHAACRAMPRAPFYATGRVAHRAVAVCATCPVAAECLDDALTTEAVQGYSWGVRGGLTGPQRHTLLASRAYAEATS